MTIFVLYKNPKQDHSSLLNFAKANDIVYAYTDKNVLNTKSCNEIIKYLEALFKDATDDDYIVLNGPSHLSAMAGYVWMTADRKKFNIIAWDIDLGIYTIKSKGYIE